MDKANKFIEEIEFTTSVYYTGKFSRGNGGVLLVSDFSVWVEIDDSDIEITKTLTVEQLKDAKVDFIKKYKLIRSSVQIEEMKVLSLTKEGCKL